MLCSPSRGAGTLSPEAAMLTKVTTPLFRSVPFASSRHQTDPSSDTTRSSAAGHRRPQPRTRCCAWDRACRQNAQSNREQQQRTVAQALNPHRSWPPLQDPPTRLTRLLPNARPAQHHPLCRRHLERREGSGHRILYGGGQFRDLSRHPDRVVVKRAPLQLPAPINSFPVPGETSLATWIFSFAEHQDQAALHLVKKRGALQEVDRNGLTRQP